MWLFYTCLAFFSHSFLFYLCFHNSHYSWVPQCTNSLTNNGAIFHPLSPNSSTTPIIIFNLYLSLTHPPRVTFSDRVAAVKGICQSRITLCIQPITCLTVLGSAYTAMHSGSIYLSDYCFAEHLSFSHSHALSFINANTHHWFISYRVKTCCTIRCFHINSHHSVICMSNYHQYLLCKRKRSSVAFNLPITKNINIGYKNGIS